MSSQKYPSMPWYLLLPVDMSRSRVLRLAVIVTSDDTLCCGQLYVITTKGIWIVRRKGNSVVTVMLAGAALY